MAAARKHRLFPDDWLSSVRGRCDVCGQQLRPRAFYLEEDADLPDPRQAWTVCSVCEEDIRRRLEQAPLQTVHRVRVAVGLVASERAGTSALRARVPDLDGDQRADRRMERLLITFFLVCFAVHALVFILIALALALR
ncbi:MAG TPA: hypothetical protein VFU88_04650 [Ktedonobacterales bacterium]|nr:hypothetical protein [Ktedonobacterales bacterium]